MNSNRRSYSDVMKMKVQYKGMSPQKKHMFANGSPLVSDLFDTLEEAAERFGTRIEIDDAGFRLSGPFQMGRASHSYSPRLGADRQEVLEYGLGYLRRLLTPVPKPLPPLVRTDVSDEEVL